MPPPRIASIVPSLTELLFALDLGDRVVARTGFCIHPRDQVRRVPKVGGTKDVDIDKLLATKPTHLIVNIDENRKDTIAILRERIPEIVVTHPLAPDDNRVLFREFGRLFECPAAAEPLAAAYHDARAALAAAVLGARPCRVLYLIWKDPWFTISRDTYVSNLLALANLQTVPAGTTARYPTLDNADSAWQYADCILLSSEPYAFRQKHVEQLRQSMAIAKPVLLADGEMLSWYGSRAIEGLRYLVTLRAQIDAAMPVEGRTT
ncbi:MAG: helical backbone metal receptor [Betaproteobacteria bacterium]